MAPSSPRVGTDTSGDNEPRGGPQWPIVDVGEPGHARHIVGVGVSYRLPMWKDRRRGSQSRWGKGGGRTDGDAADEGGEDGEGMDEAVAHQRAQPPLPHQVAARPPWKREGGAFTDALW